MSTAENTASKQDVDELVTSPIENPIEQGSGNGRAPVVQENIASSLCPGVGEPHHAEREA